MDRSLALGGKKDQRAPSPRILSESFRFGHAAIVVKPFFLWKPLSYRANSAVSPFQLDWDEVRRSVLYTEAVLLVITVFVERIALHDLFGERTASPFGKNCVFRPQFHAPDEVAFGCPFFVIPMSPVATPAT
jgi:hypothetical protein